MAKPIHSMIRVLDLDRAIAFYRAAFGFDVANRYDFDDFSLVYLRGAESDFEIELTLNKDRRQSYSHGDGYGHLAVCVADVETVHQQLTSLDFAPTPIKEFKANGTVMARFCFVQDPDGYKIEILEKLGRYR